MSRPLDRTKTLDELDRPPWGEPEYNSTPYRPRRRKLGDFGAEDFRILIGQGIDLHWLVPLALDMLEQAPLSEGDFCLGDLLPNVLWIPAGFWSRVQEWSDRI